MGRRTRWVGACLVGLGLWGLAQAPTVRAATLNADGTLSIKVNYRYPPQADDVAHLEAAMREAQLTLCDATDGQIKLNKVDVSLGESGQEGADIWLLPENARSFAGYQINLYRNNLEGLTIAHEFGHSLLGLGEDYEEQQRWGTACGIGPSFDANVRLDSVWNSIMQQSSNFYCVDKLSNKQPSEYNSDFADTFCYSDADCASACLDSSCPTDPMTGKPVPFVCPQVAVRSNELGARVNHDQLKGTGDVCPAPKAGRIMVVNVRVNPNEGRESEPAPGNPGEACGNGNIDRGEQCEAANLNGQSCASLGFAGGTLACSRNCGFDTSACTALPTCGNGTLDAGEGCEPTLGVPAGVTCHSLGFDGVDDTNPAHLSCAANCAVNVSQCPGATSPIDFTSYDTAYATSHVPPGGFQLIDSLGRIDPTNPLGGQSNHSLNVYFKRKQGDDWSMVLTARGDEFVGATPGAPLYITSYVVRFNAAGDVTAVDGGPVVSKKITIGGGFSPPFVPGTQIGDPPGGITAPPVELEVRFSGIKRKDRLDQSGVRNWIPWLAWQPGYGIFADEPGTAGDMQRGKCGDDEHCKQFWNSTTQRFETADQTGRRSKDPQNVGKPVSQWTEVSDWEVAAKAVKASGVNLRVPADVPDAPTPSEATCGGHIAIAPIPALDQVYLVLDRSGSMADPVNKPSTGSETRLQFAQAAARGFVDLQDRQATQVGLVSFSATATDDHALTKIDSTSPPPAGAISPADFKGPIDGLKADGATAIGDALKKAGDALTAAMPGNKAIVLLTDGENNRAVDCFPTDRDATTAEEKACLTSDRKAKTDALQKAGISVFSIATGGAADTGSVTSIASSTGGQHFDAAAADELPMVFAEITARLRGETLSLPRTPSTVQSVDPCRRSGEVSITCSNPSKSPTYVNGVCKCLAPNEPPPQFPESQTFAVPVEPGSGQLNFMVSSRHDVVSTWSPSFELLDPSNNVVASSTASSSQATVSDDAFYHIVKVPFPAPGLWRMKIKAENSNVQRSFLLAHVTNPKTDCFAKAESIFVKDGELPVIKASAHYGVTLGLGVSMTGYIDRPDGTSSTLNFTRDLDPTRGFYATIPASDLRGRGAYRAHVTCGVLQGAQAQPGEAIFATTPRTDGSHDPVPAAPPVRVEPFGRTATAAFFFDSKTFGPLPAGDDADNDGIPNSLEPPGDIDGDGLPNDRDTDADNDDIPDAIDTRIAPPCAITTTSIQTCVPGPQQVTLDVPSGCTGTLKSINGTLLNPAPALSSNMTLRPGSYVVSWGMREQTLSVGLNESKTACCSAGQRVLEGTSNADTMTPTAAGGYCALGFAGADYLFTPNGNDTLVGGVGADYLNASGGSNVIYGGAGADYLYGTGTLLAYGGPDADAIHAVQATSATLFGGGGQDMIVGSPGRDFIAPGSGSPTAVAGGGDDTVILYDTCEATSGLFIDGGVGDDTLITPLSVSQLAARGVSVVSIEHVIVDSSKRYLSDCFR